MSKPTPIVGHFYLFLIGGAQVAARLESVDGVAWSIKQSHDGPTESVHVSQALEDLDTFNAN